MVEPELPTARFWQAQATSISARQRLPRVAEPFYCPNARGTGAGENGPLAQLPVVRMTEMPTIVKVVYHLDESWKSVRSAETSILETKTMPVAS